VNVMGGQWDLRECVAFSEVVLGVSSQLTFNSGVWKLIVSGVIFRPCLLPKFFAKYE
jgi:hypothetical protein